MNFTGLKYFRTAFAFLLLLAFIFTPVISVAPGYAAPVPASKTTDSKAVNKEEPKANEAAGKTVQAPGADTVTTSLPADTASADVPGTIFDIKSLLQQFGIFAAIGLVIFILFIILLLKLLGGKGKAKCAQCGRKVIPGQELCENCASTREMILDMEAGSDQIAPSPRTSRSAMVKEVPVATPADVRKKTRPSGRVIATITVRKGENVGYKYSIYESQVQVSIGREPECDFVIEDEEDKEISPRHAVISVADGNVFTIYDLSSTVGVYLNGEQIKQSNLKSGDVIKISKTELTFARL